MLYLYLLLYLKKLYNKRAQDLLKIKLQINICFLLCLIYLFQKKDIKKKHYWSLCRKYTFSILHFRFVGLWLDIFSLCYPIEITPEIILDLLFFSKLVKVTPCFSLLSLLREFTASWKDKCMCVYIYDRSVIKGYVLQLRALNWDIQRRWNENLDTYEEIVLYLCTSFILLLRSLIDSPE